MLFVTLLVTMEIKRSVSTMHTYRHTQTPVNVYSYEHHLLIALISTKTSTIGSTRETTKP